MTNTRIEDSMIKAYPLSQQPSLSFEKVVPLFLSATGQWLRIHSIPPGLMRAQFVRFGIYEGERVRCIERLPGGTVVIQKNRQQIAIGHVLAKQILVLVLGSEA